MRLAQGRLAQGGVPAPKAERIPYPGHVLTSPAGPLDGDSFFAPRLELLVGGFDGAGDLAAGRPGDLPRAEGDLAGAGDFPRALWAGSGKRGRDGRDGSSSTNRGG